MKLFFNALLVLIVTVAAVFYWAVQPEKPAASQAWFNSAIKPSLARGRLFRLHGPVG